MRIVVQNWSLKRLVQTIGRLGWKRDGGRVVERAKVYAGGRDTAEIRNLEGKKA